MSNNDGLLFALGICCIWPIIVHLFLTYGLKYLRTHDLKNIQWHHLSDMWSKDE